jgi:hypothetical protein
LPDGLFSKQNHILGKFWRALLWKILVYFLTIWSILRPLEIFYGHLVYFVLIWYIFPRFGILDKEKFGNPAAYVGTLPTINVFLLEPQSPAGVDLAGDGLQTSVFFFYGDQ